MSLPYARNDFQLGTAAGSPSEFVPWSLRTLVILMPEACLTHSWVEQVCLLFVVCG
ncbi:hypothetical protein AOLI_G00262680 [Acnodon oligacanthus]